MTEHSVNKVKSAQHTGSTEYHTVRERSKERKKTSEEKSTGKKAKRHSRSGSRDNQPNTNVITSVDIQEYAENHPTTMIPVKDLGGNSHHLESSEGVRERQRLTQQSIAQSEASRWEVEYRLLQAKNETLNHKVSTLESNLAFTECNVKQQEEIDLVKKQNEVLCKQNEELKVSVEASLM